MNYSSLDRRSFQRLLANAFAVQESQVDSQSLSAINEVHRLIGKGALDVDGAIHLIVDCARKVANATGVAVGLLKGDQLVYRARRREVACLLKLQWESAFSRNVRLAGVFDDALTPSSGKAHDHDDVPEDNERVKKIDYPKTFFYSQGNDDCDHLTGEHTTQSPELRG